MSKMFPFAGKITKKMPLASILKWILKKNRIGTRSEYLVMYIYRVSENFRLKPKS